MADVDILKDLIRQFMPFAQKHIGFENPPRLFLRNDPENGAKPLGKTAFYDPAKMCVTLYVTDRHPKDILRSLGHELVHHKQNCEGMFDDAGEMGEGYAQTDPHLRQMEIDANRDGTTGVYVKDPFGNYLEYIWYSDDQKEVFLNND